MNTRTEDLDLKISTLELMIKDPENSHILTELKPRHRKLKKLSEMRKKLIDQEKILKVNYLSIIKERNLYFEKLRMIEAFGEENGWEDDNNLLQKIHSHLINLRKQHDNSLTNS